MTLKIVKSSPFETNMTPLTKISSVYLMVFVIHILAFIWSPSQVARYQRWDRLLQFQGCRRVLHLQGCNHRHSVPAHCKSILLSYDDYDSSDDITEITYSSSDTDTDDDEEASIASQIQIPNITSNEPVESIRSCSTISRVSKEVQFSTVSIREYPRIVGEHIPSRGPPLSIDWDYSKEQIHHVDDYEESVLVCGTTRRFQSKLKKIPVQQRIELLRSESECTAKQILEATKHSNIIRNQRKRTRETLHLQPFHELCEKVIRRITIN